ncbi:MAG: zf-HC2 domain-containing protein [Acidobacteriota bacterium]
MHCRDIKIDLALYRDGGLLPQTRAAIDLHLSRCPLCRQKLAEHEIVGERLRAVPRAQMPESILSNIRRSIGSFPQAAYSSPNFQLIGATGNWLDRWLMPFAAGGVASVVAGITLLWLVLMTPPSNLDVAALRKTPERPVMIARSIPDPAEYAGSRVGFSAESPSVNPQGALVALTRSLVRGEMEDDEVVVVADVFRNGMANIAEVVEPSRDRKAVEELQKALQSDPAFAPFVPADIDQRSDTVRVVLKIQSINVYTNSKRTAN